MVLQNPGGPSRGKICAPVFIVRESINSGVLSALLKTIAPLLATAPWITRAPPPPPRTRIASPVLFVMFPANVTSYAPLGLSRRNCPLLLVSVPAATVYVALPVAGARVH